MNKPKKLHNLLLGTSVLPVLILMPAMAEDNQPTHNRGDWLGSYYVQVGKVDESETFQLSQSTLKEGESVSGGIQEDGSIQINAIGYHSYTNGNNKKLIYGVFNNAPFVETGFKIWSTTIKDSLFKENTANYGSAISLWNYGTREIGVPNPPEKPSIHPVDDSTVKHFVINTVFEKNSAEIAGAAIALFPNNDFITAGNTEIEKSKFLGNVSKGQGGAIADQSHNLTINSSSFIGNKAETSGGAIVIDDLNTNLGLEININDTDFAENQAEVGGAIANVDMDTTVNVNGGEFKGNTATRGGAIYSYGILNIDGGTFDKNSSTDRGGAIDVNAGDAIIKNSKFTKNTSMIGGGVSSVFDLVNLVKIEDSTFDNNSALVGGAIAGYFSLDVSGTTFTNNRTTGNDDGGGAIVLGGHGKTTIENSVFDGNIANVGGAIATRPKESLDFKIDGHWMNINNSVFKNNVADAGDDNGKKYKSNYKNFYHGDGGALWTGFVGSTIDGVEHANSIQNTSFVSNEAKNNGGAIYNEGVNTLSNVTFEGNRAAKNGGAIYNDGTLNFAGQNTFTGNQAVDGADIFNNGTLNFADGTTTIDGGISGNGSMIIAENATLNIGDAMVKQNSVELNGTMIANLTNHGDNAIITADTFGGTGTMSLIARSAGEYKVFSKATDFDNSNINIDSVLYNLHWNDDNTSLTATLKPTEDIATKTGLTENATNTVVNVVSAEPDKLNEFGLLMQEHLANGDTDAVEKAHHVISPEKAPAVHSVASRILGTVTKLAANRMNTTSVMGRNGGDVDLTAGGVWAQGLYNKSKLNGEFNGYTRGISAGMDGTINRVVTIGAGYAFSHTDLDLKYHDTEVDSNTLFVYGQYKPSRWYANTILNYTMSDYSEKGSALGVLVHSDYKINSFGGQVMTGYDFANGITPEMGLRYLHVNGKTYTNSLDVRNKIDSGDFLIAILGGKYAKNFAISESMILRPEVRLAGKYNVLTSDENNTVTMPGVDSYRAEGSRLHRFGAETGLGLTMSYKEVNVSLNYDIEVRKDYTSQTGMLKAKYNF